MKHLERAFDQQNQGWKYFLVFLIALFIGQSFGAIPLFVVIAYKSVQAGGTFEIPDNSMDFSAYGIDPNFGLFLVVIPFLVTLVIAILLVKSFHHRTINDVINGGSKFRWNRFWAGLGIWAIFLLASLIIALLIEPDNFEMQFDLSSFLPLIVISVLFIPFQSATEEYLFRGYLAQGVAAWTKQPWLVILIPSILFALLHSMNPEVGEHGFWTVMPSYLLFGIVFALVSILDDGIELAIGIHASNNVFSSIFVTHKSSVLQTPALFLQKEVDPGTEFRTLLFVSVIFIGILTFIYKWKFGILTKKIVH